MILSKTKEDTICEYMSQLRFVKLVLAFAVVLYHSCLAYADDWFPYTTHNINTKYLLFFAGWLNSFHIYAFVLVSGFIFYYIKNIRGGYISFIKKKTQRLIVPAICISIIWVIPIAELFFHYSLKEIILRYCLATAPNQLWFLWMLFWVFIISWPLSNMFLRFKGAAIVAVLYCIGNLGGNLIPNVFQIRTGCMYVTFFYIGYMFCRLIERLNNNVAIAFALLTINVISYCSLQFNEFSDNVVNKLIVFGLKLLMNTTGAVAAFLILNSVAPYVVAKHNALIKRIGDKTMSLFLFHQQIIYLAICIANGKLNPIVQVVFSFTAALAGSFVINELMMKHKITRWMIGEKSFYKNE